MEKIAVIGIGRLGLCLALNLERVGYKVIGVDVNTGLVDSLNNKTFKTTEPLVQDYLKESRNFVATTNLDEIFNEGISILFVVLPTPSLPDGFFDHSALTNIAHSLIKHGKREKPHHLIINSTTMPGYCNELNKIVEEYNYVVSYNPEFIAQGSIISDQQNPDQVLIGEGSNEAGDIIESIYSRLCHKTPVFCRMQPLSAEITKLATNCFLTTKIAFANAIGDLARSAGAEPEKVLNAIGADSRIGNKYFRYGFGYGGPCFPRDNRALGEFSKKAGYQLLIGEATDAANEAHAGFLSTQWMQENEAGKTIELDSVTYKPGTDILEESQQLKLALDLAKAGRKVHIHESAAVIAQLKNLFGNIFQYSENGY